MFAKQKKLWIEHKKLQNEIVNDAWKSFTSDMENIVTDYGEIWSNFLRTRVIQHTMYVCSGGDFLEKELQFVKNYFPMEIAIEPTVGNPVLFNGFSHNTIHHLYHIARYAKNFGLEKFKSNKSFVEWGGGYGNFARLTKKINQDCTYTIIDLPILNIIQYRYLSSVFGEDKINIVSENEQPTAGKINLVSSSWFEKCDINADFFISTWALSESPILMQDKINNKNWFNTTGGLFAMHTLPAPALFGDESINLSKLLEVNGYKKEMSGIQENQAYLIK